jgi:hypothetical protein
MRAANDGISYMIWNSWQVQTVVTMYVGLLEPFPHGLNRRTASMFVMPGLCPGHPRLFLLEGRKDVDGRDGARP